MYSKKYRNLMGNVCLTLFLAFMFMLNPFTLHEARVLAQTEPDVVLPEKVTVGQGGQITIGLTITPLTNPFSGTVKVTLQFRRGGQTVKEGVYTAQSVYSNAYQILLNVVYNAPSEFPVGTVFELSHGSVTVGDVVYVVVYLDEVQTPPPEGPGGGAPSAGVGGAVTSVGTDTGWISVNPVTGVYTGYVDPELARDVLIQSPGVATLLDMVKAAEKLGGIPQNAVANVPASVFESAVSLGTRSVKLNLGYVEVSGVPGAFLANDLKAQGPLATLKILSTVRSPEDTQGVLEGLPQDEVANLKAASRLYDLSFRALALTGSEKEIKQFNGKITFGFSYDPSVVSNPKHLNVYERGSLRYVGGKVDVSQNKVFADLSGLNSGEFIVMEHNKTFSDVQEGYWAKDDIELMASKYVVNGMTTTTFAPESLVTRAQFTTMLVRALGLPEEKPDKATFSDVAPGSWYYGYVEAAVKKGLVQGDSGTGGLFRPEDRITREEMAAVLVRAMKWLGYAGQTMDAQRIASILSSYNDGNSVSSWAQVELAQAIDMGLVKGRDGNLLVPQGNGKRAEAATLMSRFMAQIGLI